MIVTQIFKLLGFNFPNYGSSVLLARISGNFLRIPEYEALRAASQSRTRTRD